MLAVQTPFLLFVNDDGKCLLKKPQELQDKLQDYIHSAVVQIHHYQLSAPEYHHQKLSMVTVAPSRLFKQEVGTGTAHL